MAWPAFIGHRFQLGCYYRIFQLKVHDHAVCCHMSTMLMNHPILIRNVLMSTVAISWLLLWSCRPIFKSVGGSPSCGPSSRLHILHHRILGLELQSNATTPPQIKSISEHAQQETPTHEDERYSANTDVSGGVRAAALVTLSGHFRQRGLPRSTGSPTLVGMFRAALDFSPIVKGHERKFMQMVT
jgi:hypothetical protein